MRLFFHLARALLLPFKNQLQLIEQHPTQNQRRDKMIFKQLFDHETWTYTYSRNVTQNDIDTIGIDGDGFLENTAEVDAIVEVR